MGAISIYVLIHIDAIYFAYIRVLLLVSNFGDFYELSKQHIAIDHRAQAWLTTLMACKVYEDTHL